MDDNSPTLDIKIDPVKSEADGYFHTLSVRKEARSRKVAVTFLNQYLIPLSSFEGKKRICIVFVLPDHNTSLRPYKRQKIVAPVGISEVLST
jgi:hypothetical protein